MPSLRIASAVLSSALLAACGGGAASHAVPAGPEAIKSGSAVVRLTIPAAATTAAVRRSPRYVSPSTQSLLIAVQSVNGQSIAYPSIALNVTVPSAACPAPSQAGQPETCTFNVVLPVGAVFLTVTTYDHTLTGTTPQGNALSSTSVYQQLTGNGDPILLTLNGKPVSATLSVASAPLPVGTSAAISVSATALDADGNLIIGPGEYTSPIVVAVTDPTSRVSVGIADIAGPGMNASLTYNGGAGLTPVTVTGSASGVTVTPTTLHFVPGLIRSDALSQITTPVHYLAISPDGTTANIPYQDASNANAPTLLVVSTASRAVIAHTQVVTQEANANTIVSNVAFSSATPSTTLVGYSDSLNVNGVASLATATGTLLANDSVSFAPQYIASLKNSPNYFAFGTSTTDNSGFIEQFSAVTGTVLASYGTLTCAAYDQCLIASPDGALVFAPYQTGDNVDSMRANGTTGPTIGTDGPVTAQTFSTSGTTIYLAVAASNGTTSIETVPYPGIANSSPFTTVPNQFSALATSPDGTTLLGSSSLSSSPVTLIDIASKTSVTFGPTLSLGQFAGGFISPAPLSTTGSRRFLVVRQYQQPAGSLHTTLDEYVY